MEMIWGHEPHEFQRKTIRDILIMAYDYDLWLCPWSSVQAIADSPTNKRWKEQSQVFAKQLVQEVRVAKCSALIAALLVGYRVVGRPYLTAGELPLCFSHTIGTHNV